MKQRIATAAATGSRASAPDRFINTQPYRLGPLTFRFPKPLSTMSTASQKVLRKSMMVSFLGLGNAAERKQDQLRLPRASVNRSWMV